jgi:Tol biopolymer transport system component
VSVSSAGAEAGASSGDPSLSGDGRIVAFDTIADDLVPGDGNGVSDVFVRDVVAGTTTRVSTTSGGAEGDGHAGDPAVSENGRVVAFASLATDLVPGDANGDQDVFVKDLATGATTRVSTDAAGGEGNGDSMRPAVSADGRFVAFRSRAANLVPGDTNGVDDVFVKDRATGAVERVSTSSAGVQGSAPVLSLSISGDGRLVAFSSDAPDLVPGDANGVTDVFVKDRVTGELRRISVGPSGAEGDGESGLPDLSSDGRYVVFSSRATMLVSGDDNNARDIFRHDLATGALERVYATGPVYDEGSSDFPEVSGDGRMVAFSSTAGLVHPDGNGVRDVFVKDMVSGGMRRISLDAAGGELAASSGGAAMSANGQIAAFTSAAGAIVPGDANGATDVFRVDLGAPPAPGGGASPAPGGGSGAAGPAPGATPAPAAPTASRYRCRGLRATIVGTPGRDVIRGTRGADVIVALGGADRIHGLRGNDVVCAGRGNDVVIAGRGRDRVYGGPGRDRILTGAGADVAHGGAGNDRISTGRGPDRAFGGSGRDVLVLGRGADRGWGGAGRDRLAGGPGPDLLHGGRARDRGVGGPGRDRCRSVEIRVA